MPLVACSNCSQQVSDVAETCPKCGHPQPKQEAARGAPSGTCTFCHTFNLLFRSEKCRGCQRPLHEACEYEYVADYALDVHSNALLSGRMGGGLAAVASLAAACVVLHPAGGCASALCPALLPALLVYAVVNGAVQWVVRRYALRTGLTDPSHLADKVRQHLASHDLGAKHKPKNVPSAWIWPAVLIGVGGVGLVSSVADSWSKAHEEQERIRRDAEFRIKAATHLIYARLQSGLFSKSLELINGSAPAPKDHDAAGLRSEAFSQCDLTVTVTLDTGVRVPIKRYWERWAAGEVKAIDLPPEGHVERVEVKGTVKDDEGEYQADVDMNFRFGSK